MKYLYLLLLFTISNLLVSDKNSSQSYVKYELNSSSIKMNENDSSKLVAKVTIADDTYIYLNKLNPKAVNTVTSFSISDPSFSVIIEKAPKGKVTKDKDYLSLEKSGNFELTIFDSGLKRKEKSGKFELKMLTQACTKAGVCYKAATLSKEIKFEISGARKVFSSNTRNLSTKEVNWLTKYNEAKEKAKKTGQNIYVVVSAPEWCGPCRYMDQNTFKAKTVSELLNHSFIPLYIHADNNPDVSNFPVRGIPAHLVQDSTGKTLFQTAGAMDESRFVSSLSTYAKKSSETNTTNTTNTTDSNTTTNNPPELPDNIPLPDLVDTKPTVNSNIEKINSVFDEGGRYQVRNVKISNSSNVFTMNGGGKVKVEMEIKHDCSFCGNSVNQILVGLGGEDKAQLSVWNGKQRSGGRLKIVNPNSNISAFAEDNSGQAEWVKVFFELSIPSKKGIYYIRTRYAQDHQGNIYTADGLNRQQPIYQKVLGWWKVDRPNGPDSSSNIGAVIVN